MRNRSALATMHGILLSILLLPTLAIGAGFDCKKVGTQVERLICANTELSTLDEALSDAFSLEVERTESLPTFGPHKKPWRHHRTAYCAHYGALEVGSDGWKNAFAGMCEVDENKTTLMKRCVAPSSRLIAVNHRPDGGNAHLPSTSNI